MHVLERNGHIDQNVTDEFRQHIIATGEEDLEVVPFHVLHHAVGLPADFAMVHIADDVVVIMDLAENLATSVEAFLGEKIEAQALMHQAQGVTMALGITDMPDVRHAAAVDAFVQAIRPKGCISCDYAHKTSATNPRLANFS